MWNAKLGWNDRIIFQPLTICSTVKSCHVMFLRNIWDNVFKNEPSKTCGRFEVILTEHIPPNFSELVFHKFYLAHSWVLCLIYVRNHKVIWQKLRKIFFILHILRVKGPYSEFFWSVFSRIWIEYEDILRISPYSIRMWENKN